MQIKLVTRYLAISFFCNSLISASVYATTSVYVYKDDHGNMVVGNESHNGSRKMKLPDVPVYVNPMTKADINANGYTEAPVINNKKNNYTSPLENGRRNILSSELVHEKEALLTSQQLLANAKKINDQNHDANNSRIQILNDEVIAHQKNIEILTKQLQ
jgi:hypothetical protein